MHVHEMVRPWLPRGRADVHGLPALIAASIVISLFCTSPLRAAGAWRQTGSLSAPRRSQTATLLADGRVLIAGGATGIYADDVTDAASLYDPASETWRDTDPMPLSGKGHTTTRLNDGRVLAVNNGKAALYDPTTERWSATDSLSAERTGHTATLLPDGRVLVAGGTSHFAGDVANSGGTLLATAELYDPASGAWTPTGSMHYARLGHSATLLTDGRVLVAGGVCCSTQTPAPAELYDPATGGWTTTGNPTEQREGHTATLLQNGNVLIVGGWSTVGGVSTALATAERYDPATGLWRAVGGMTIPRASHTATLLPTGQVLVTGGSDVTESKPLATTELYDPAADRWLPGEPMQASRASHTATLLADGELLVAGGVSKGEHDLVALASAELSEQGPVQLAAVGSAGVGPHPRAWSSTLLLGAALAMLLSGFACCRGARCRATIGRNR